MDQARQKALIAFAAFLLSAPAARADTVEQLLARCETSEEPTFGAGYCYGYFNGVVDKVFNDTAAKAVFGGGGVMKPPYCPPTGITNRQRVAIFVKYAKDRPDIWSYPADANLLNALAKAFPCTP